MKWRRVVPVGLAAMLAVGSLGGVAVADDAAEGQWYIDNFGVPGGWAKGYDGSGVTIALIDSPIDPSVPWLQGADVETFGNPLCNEHSLGGPEPLPGTTTDQVAARHGTGMVGLYVGNGDDGNGGPGLKGVAPGARVLVFPNGTVGVATPSNSYACFPRTGLSKEELADLGATAKDMGSDITVRGAAAAVQINGAIDEGADIIHMPFELEDIVPGSSLETALLRAQREGVILVTGKANDTKHHLEGVSSAPRALNYFPGVLTVSSLDRDDSLSAYVAVRDPGVDILAPGGGLWMPHATQDDLDAYFEVTDGGTSSASAIMTGYLALLMSKYPEATGNQILHAVISSTLDGEGKAIRDPDDTRGWGSFTFKYAGATDPTTYPDTNPIFDYDLERIQDHYTNYNSDDYDPDDWEDGLYPTKMADWGVSVAGYHFPLEESPETWWPNIVAYYNELHTDATTEPSEKPTTDAAGDTHATTIPVWVWIAAGGGILLAGGIVITAVMLSRRRKPQPIPQTPPPPYPYPTQGPGQGPGESGGQFQ